MPWLISLNNPLNVLKEGILTHQPERICILPARLGLGGPASFQSGLIKSFKIRGVEVIHDPLDPSVAAILLFGAARNLAAVRQAQSRGVRVVQRLNGMNWVHRKKYTGMRHFIKAEAGNLKLRAVRKMADRVIYQSQFARDWWEREHGILDKPQVVIHNGVDLELFSPLTDAKPSDRYRLLMVEAHHGSGYDQGLRSALQLLQDLENRLDKPCELAVVGDVPPDLQQQMERPGVAWLGVVKHTEIPSIDRTAHLFFSGDINATCPNAVLEALACGLPVLAYDTGAMRELVPPSAGRVVAYGGNVWNLERADGATLAEGALEILAAQAEMSRDARQHAVEHFDIGYVAKQYLEVLLGD